MSPISSWKLINTVLISVSESIKAVNLTVKIADFGISIAVSATTDQVCCATYQKKMHIH